MTSKSKLLEKKQKRLKMLEDLERFSSVVIIQSLIRGKLSRRIREIKGKLSNDINKNNNNSPVRSPKVPKLELNTMNSNNNTKDGKLSSPLMPKQSVESPKRKKVIDSPLDLENRMQAEMNRKSIRGNNGSKNNTPRSGNTTPTTPTNRTSILKSPRSDRDKSDGSIERSKSVRFSANLESTEAVNNDNVYNSTDNNTVTTTPDNTDRLRPRSKDEALLTSLAKATIVHTLTSELIDYSESEDLLLKELHKCDALQWPKLNAASYDYITIKKKNATNDSSGGNTSNSSGEEDDAEEDVAWPSLEDTTTIDANNNGDVQDEGNSNGDILNWIRTYNKLLVRTVTWNLEAKPPPPVEDVVKTLIPRNKYHMIIVGTEECERSIAQSALLPSKKNWESYCLQMVGDNYLPVHSQTLQAIHIVCFVHKAVAPLIKEVKGASVPTGIGNVLGNKGCTAIQFMFASTSFLVINAHLAAHQDGVDERNLNFQTIAKKLPRILAKRKQRRSSSSNALSLMDNQNNLMLRRSGSFDMGSDTAIADANDHSTVPNANAFLRDSQDSSINVSSSFDLNGVNNSDAWKGESISNISDRVIFMGDLNYRIQAPRRVVDVALQKGRIDVLLPRDQLSYSKNNSQVIFQGFTENEIKFKPTYKFDSSVNIYDTSSKQRIPSWTDRILYVPRGLDCLSYNSDMTIRSSDHRPVYATFACDVDISSHEDYFDGIHDDIGVSESQVCTIM